jgi:hypothetical protein
LITILRFACLVLSGLSIALTGCGTESTAPVDGNGETGQPVNYLSPEVGYEQYYRLFDHNLLPAGTSRFAIIDQFVTADRSGYIAVDSMPRWIDTLNWVDTFRIIAVADTVFELVREDESEERWPLVRNHTQTDFSRHLYSVGDLGSSARYHVFFRQLPETETVVLTSGDIFVDCGRIDRLAVYELTGDTVHLGSEYFAPNIGRVLSTTRLYVESAVYYRELIR